MDQIVGVRNRRLVGCGRRGLLWTDAWSCRVRYGTWTSTRPSAPPPPHLADLLGHDSPTLHLRRRQDGGPFDRYAEHVEHLWAAGRDIWE